MKSAHMVSIYQPTWKAGLLWFSRLDRRGLVQFLSGSTLELLDHQSLMNKLTHGCSLLRWGDGETALLRQKNIWHQTASEEIAVNLEKVLAKLGNTHNVIFCMPIGALQGSYFDRKSWFWLNRKQLWATRVLFNLPSHRSLVEKPISDAGMFYSNPLLIFEILELLGAKNRDVVFVSHVESPELRNFLPNLLFLPIKQRDSFEEFAALREELLFWTSQHARQPLVIFAGGPTVKILCVEMSDKFQFLDLGIGVKFLNSTRKRMDWEEI